jgi:hypothetical protein
MWAYVCFLSVVILSAKAANTQALIDQTNLLIATEQLVINMINTGSAKFPASDFTNFTAIPCANASEVSSQLHLTNTYQTDHVSEFSTLVQQLGTQNLKNIPNETVGGTNSNGTPNGAVTSCTYNISLSTPEAFLLTVAHLVQNIVGYEAWIMQSRTFQQQIKAQSNGGNPNSGNNTLSLNACGSQGGSSNGFNCDRAILTLFSGASLIDSQSAAVLSTYADGGYLPGPLWPPFVPQSLGAAIQPFIMSCPYNLNHLISVVANTEANGGEIQQGANTAGASTVAASFLLAAAALVVAH